MGKINRREFFEEIIATQEVNAPLNAGEDLLFKKYANTTIPTSANKTTSGLNPYTGQWTQAEVIHLLNRTTFGLKYEQVKSLEKMTMSDAVDLLLNVSATPPPPPVNNYNTSTYTDPTGVAAGQPWVTAAYGDGTVNSKRRLSLKSWWIGQMINQGTSILEKMVLFWHNHFPIETNIVGDARICYNYNALLRAHAVGNFKTLTRQITTDPAMLRYLNGYLNTNTAPDENYARELQELFTIGKGLQVTYTEDDVKAAARVLTGWRYSSTTLTSYFQASKHDTANKSFSNFYGKYIITGKTGTAGAGETDELINLIFNKPEPAILICRELYKFFVYYVIDQDVETNVILPLAQQLQLNNYDIKPVLAALLKSEHFYDVNSRGCYIRTPFDFLIGTFRVFDIQLPANFTPEKNYAVWNYIRYYGDILNMQLGDPPNVAGWPAYYQEPEYYELWINSTTLPRRFAFTDMMLASGFSAGTGTAIKIDVLHFAKKFLNGADPNAMVDYCCKMLLGLDVDASHKQHLKTTTLLSGQSTDSYWTAAWIGYLNNPTTANANIVKPRLLSLISELTKMAEHHLC